MKPRMNVAARKIASGARLRASSEWCAIVTVILLDSSSAVLTSGSPIGGIASNSPPIPAGPSVGQVAS